MLTLRLRYRLALTACLGAGSVAAAQTVSSSPPLSEPGSLCPPCLHDEILRGLPVDIEAVVAVNGGTRQRASTAGQALTGMIQNSGAMAETVQAWRLLAATLGWTPERTFDELLGRRASLMMRRVSAEPEAGGSDWALMSEVSTDTQRRLRERLKAAPRGAIAGMSVLSIEDGSFEFVVSPEVAQVGGLGRGAIILLAPRHSENMLDELAPALNVISAAPDGPSPKACDVVVAWHKAASDGGDAAQSLTVTARATEAGWDATVVCSPIFVLGPATVKPTRWSDSTFKSLETGSLLAVMSTTGSGHPVEPLAFIPAAVRSWVDELSLGLGESGLRVAAFVRAVDFTPPQTTSTAVVAGAGVAAARNAVSPRQGRLSVTVAAETSDPKKALVRGDLAIANFAKMLMSGCSETGGNLPGVQLEIADRGPRLLRLGEALTVHPDLEPSMTRAFGETPLLAWNTVASARPQAAGEGTGWWVASLSPMGTGDRDARAFAALETGQPKARLCIGVVRPAAIDRWISAIEPEVLGPIPGASFVESFRWDFWVRDDGQVEGTVNLRMAAPSATMTK